MICVRPACRTQDCHESVLFVAINATTKGRRDMMKRYFQGMVPQVKTELVASFEELAEAYRQSTLRSQREGILHRVAKNADEKGVGAGENAAYAAYFLMQVASQREVVEPDCMLGNTALDLLFQRVLPKLPVHQIDCREHVMQFLAEDGDMRTRIPDWCRQYVHKFLENEWHPMNRFETDRKHPGLLVDATINTGFYDLLVRDRAPLEAILKLYNMLRTDWRKLASPLWSVVFEGSDFGGFRDMMSVSRDLHEQYSDDCEMIVSLCGAVIAWKHSDPSRVEAAKVLLVLLSILVARMKQLVL